MQKTFWGESKHGKRNRIPKYSTSSTTIGRYILGTRHHFFGFLALDLGLIEDCRFFDGPDTTTDANIFLPLPLLPGGTTSGVLCFQCTHTAGPSTGVLDPLPSCKSTTCEAIVCK